MPWTRSPPFPGVTPATTFVPYSNIFSVWNWPWWPVMPWTMSFVSSSRRTAILGTSRPHLHRQLRGLLHRVRRRTDPFEDFPRPVLVHALDPRDDGDVHLHLLERLLHSEGDGVCFRDPAEDVQKDHRWLRLQEDLERLLHLLRVVRPAEVEERSATPALQVQAVEGRHREARPVRDHADVPVELDERYPLVVGLLLEGRPVLREVRVLRMAVLRVVVDDQLRVPRHHAAVIEYGERVDLHELRVLPIEQGEGFAGDIGDLGRGILREAESFRECAEYVGLQADERRDVDFEDRFLGDGFDLHSAGRTGD